MLVSAKNNPIQAENALTARLLIWLHGFLPAPGNTRRTEQLRSGCGALIGLLLTGLICTRVPGFGLSTPMLIALMGRLRRAAVRGA